MRLETPTGFRDVGAIATDLDRTLTDARLRVVPRALAGLARARRQGARTVLLSGRTWAELARRPTLRGRFDVVVAESGAVVGDARTSERPPTPSEWESFLEWLRREEIPYRSGRASVSVPVAHATALRRRARAWSLSLHPNRDRIDVTSVGIDKGVGLARALAQLKVAPRDCLVFGDARNDLPAFRAAGYAVAVGNAEGPVKAAADEVAPGIGGRAVAAFIEARLLGGAAVGRR